MSGLGAGNAWLKDHKAILDHAEGLHYDHYLESIGKSLPSAVNPNDYTEEEKQRWISAMDNFNSWKAANVPLEDSGKAWWQTYTGNVTTNPTDPVDDDTTTTPPKDDDTTTTDPGINKYFPMLDIAYDAPEAQDWTAYGPRGQQRPNVRPGDIWGGSADLMRNGGLLYQPWTSTYADKYNKGNMFDYIPPTGGYTDVTYTPPPFGDMNVTPPEEIFDSKDDEEDDDLDDRGI